MTFKGIVWRHVPAGAHPLHVGFILKARGRWNRAGEYGALYTSLTTVGARAEHLKYLAQAGVIVPTTPRDLVSLDVEVAPIVDLTDQRSSPVDPSSSFLTSDSRADVEACRGLADFIRAGGHCGIIAPSAAAHGEKNLIIYIDLASPSSIRLDVGTDRIRL